MRHVAWRLSHLKGSVRAALGLCQLTEVLTLGKFQGLQGGGFSHKTYKPSHLQQAQPWAELIE